MLVVQKVPLNSPSVSAEAVLLPGDRLLVTNLEEKQSGRLNSTEGITMIFKIVEAVSYRKIFVDLKNIRLLTSFSWGAVFTAVANLYLTELHFFNASEAILTTARQMGIGTEQSGANRSKIRVSLDDRDENVQDVLEIYEKTQKRSQAFEKEVAYE